MLRRAIMKVIDEESIIISQKEFSDILATAGSREIVRMSNYDGELGAVVMGIVQILGTAALQELDERVKLCKKSSGDNSDDDAIKI